eukprot:m.52845 g.52845  ORF g.52845 m.52845 type:complete len:120 (-) comp9128_c0_seq4:1076-1435(-)
MVLTGMISPNLSKNIQVGLILSSTMQAWTEQKCLMQFTHEECLTTLLQSAFLQIDALNRPMHLTLQSLIFEYLSGLILRLFSVRMSFTLGKLVSNHLMLKSRSRHANLRGASRSHPPTR